MDYIEGSARSTFQAGTFYIDTGYDDPVAWNSSYAVTELYAARVYLSNGGTSFSLGAGAYAGRWIATATPCWSVDFYQPPSPGAVSTNRIFIRVDVALHNPPVRFNGATYTVGTATWALYRA